VAPVGRLTTTEAKAIGSAFDSGNVRLAARLGLANQGAPSLAGWRPLFRSRVVHRVEGTMAIDKPLDEIGLEDLQRLLTNGVAESRSLEYKQVLPTGTDSDRKEFLVDVSSFANAIGGDQGRPGHIAAGGRI
jgi:hypothetical protein